MGAGVGAGDLVPGEAVTGAGLEVREWGLM